MLDVEPTLDTAPLRLTFGSQPPPEAIHAWGCRAIQHYYPPVAGRLYKRPDPDWKPRIEFVYDRQSAAGGKDDAFMAWVNKTGYAWAESVGVKLRPNDVAVRQMDDGKYHVKVSTNASYGYIYVCCWETAP